MFKMKTVALAVAALSVVGTVQAAETAFSYTQLSIAVVGTQFDDDINVPATYYSYEVYDDMGGAALSGSYQFDNNLILGITGAYQENDGSHTEINKSDARYTVGYALPVTPVVDVVFKGGLAYTELEVCSYGCASEDDTGLYGSVGVRGWATSWLELNASADYADYDDFESTKRFQIGAAGWFNDSSSIFLDLSKTSNGISYTTDTKEAALGYRYSF